MRIIVVLLGILCLALARLSGNNWRTPAALYTIIWTTFCILPSCILWTYIDWDYFGLLWIETSCVVFCIGQAIGISRNGKIMIHSNDNRSQSCKRKFNLDTNMCRRIMFIMFVICVMHIFRSLITRGFSLSVFYNLESLLAINSDSASSRYNGDSTPSIINQLFLIVEYSLPLLGGFAVSFFEKKKGKALCVLSLLPVFVSFILSNAKAGFIASTMGFVITYMIGSYVANGKEKRFSFKFIRNTIILLMLFLGVLFISFCLRAGDFAVSTLNYVFDKYVLYMFGQMKAFDEWFVNDSANVDLTVGAMTYNWFFNLTGIVDRQSGVYGFAQSIRTNVFTIFRGIITDYGKFGGLIYCLFRGVAGGYLYKLISRRNNVGPHIITMMATIYIFFLFGLFISPWTYTTCFAAYSLFAFVLYICRLKGDANVIF